MKIENVQQLTTILKLVSEFKLDMLEIDGIKIIKSKHEFPQIKSKEQQQDELEELLYLSSNQY